MDRVSEAPWLAQRAKATPEREALRCEGRSISYAALDRGARRAGRALCRAGVEAGERVAVAVAPGPHALELLHGLSYARAVLLPLNLRLTAAELEYQLRDCGATRVVVEGDDAGAGAAREAASRVGAALHELAELHRGVWDDGDDGDDGRLARRIDAASPFAILYTSGTSGRPKGATLSYANFRASAVGSAQLLGVRSDDLWLACMPLFHVGGLSIATRSVLAGTSMLLHRRFDPAAVARDLDREGVTLVSLVASMLARVLDARGDAGPPPQLRAALLGGGPTPPSLIERARKAGFPVAPTYGLTEATSQVATRPPDARGEPLDAGLQPLPGLRVQVVDASGRPLAPGAVGEVRVQGPTVMGGYWGRPDESARALAGGWLHTGDLGALDADGRLRIVDRRSDLIVSGGENVYPAEVEAVLMTHPGVAEAAVVGEPDPVYGRRPVACIVVRPGGPLWGEGPEGTHAALVAHCRDRLARYKVPVRFERVESLPRTATGKLRRRDVRSPAVELV
ncbi:MAG: o-succinylbenzoate--CoA ligase [Myxococcota bacterium]